MRHRPDDRLAAGRPQARARARSNELSDREREVLALVAEGHSNGAIGEKLFLSRKTVESHISKIFAKLDLGAVAGSAPRVLAVLAFLRSS